MVGRLIGMAFSRPLVIESALSASQMRARVRAFATTRDLPELEAFRRRQIVSWRLSKANEDFLFQPEYGDLLDFEGARFVGLVEPAAAGSRIRGNVVASPLTKLVTSVSMLFVTIATLAALAQGREPAVKVLGIASITIAGTLIMVRYSLRSTSRVVEARLREYLEASGPRAAA